MNSNHRNIKTVICFAAVLIAAVVISAACSAKQTPADKPQEANATAAPESAQEVSQAAEPEAEPDPASPPSPAYSPGSYEIHLLLDSDSVLDEDHQLKKGLLDEFGVTKKPKTYGLIYLETPEKAFLKEGWINRLRMREDKPEKGLEITYKRRHRVSDGDIDAAMKAMVEEGFDFSEDTWETQIEWGYSEMTLSVSTEISMDAGAGGLTSIADLSLEDALSMAGENMPPAEQNKKAEHWGIETLEAAQMAGPVYFKRYTGKFLEQKVQIEIWDLPEKGAGEDSFITELSFEAEDFETASALRDQMMEYLSEKGILVPEDALKTRRILDLFFN